MIALIHMNGRIYDPKLGRMLQADPFVQFPKYSQSLNRYSYVLNNPLSYTDPSGYFVSELFNFARAVVRIFASEGFDVTAWADLVTSAIALINAFSGQAAAFIPGIAIGSVARSGGSLSKGQGNSQSSREIEGLFRDPRMATLGGTVSEITNNKFGNGAVTASMGHTIAAVDADESNKEKAREKYRLLQQSLSTRAANQPVGALDLSVSELKTILEWTRVRTLDEPIHSGWVWDDIDGHFAAYDTFLRRPEFSSRQFKIDGQVVWGGHLNY